MIKWIQNYCRFLELLSVPRINIIACAIILGETNNFENFSSSKKLLEFGCSPFYYFLYYNTYEVFFQLKI